MSDAKRHVCSAWGVIDSIESLTVLLQVRTVQLYNILVRHMKLIKSES